MGRASERRAGAVTGFLLSATVLSACHGEPKALEPRTPPGRTPPAVALPAAPLAPGHGRVVLHGTDGSLRITGRSDTTFVPPGGNVPPNRTGELCDTPCVVDLPAGRYKLYMTNADGSYQNGDSDMLVVPAEQLTYYLRAPGKFEQPQWIPVGPGVLIALATLSVLGGAALISDGDDSGKTTGAILIGGGAAVGIAGGIWYYDASRGAIQQGATTTWSQPIGAGGMR